MKNEVSKLDPRLQGKTVKDITLAFVMEEATEEEVNTAFVAGGKRYTQRWESSHVVDRGELRGVGVGDEMSAEQMVGDLIAAKLFVKCCCDIDPSSVFTWDDDKCVIKHYTKVLVDDPSKPELKGEKALQKIWKDQVKKYLNDLKELDTYLLLKAKFEGN